MTSRLPKLVCLFWLTLVATAVLPAGENIPVVKPVLELRNSQTNDQDDMCLWTHPSQPGQSVVIASDKAANKIFVYNLKGETLQVVPISKPGNIDLRQGVSFGGDNVDVVGVNLRKERKIALFQVDPVSRLLKRIDDDRITTGSNYGGTLYCSPKSRKLYFLCTSEDQEVEQYELARTGTAPATGRRVRQLSVGKCEGAVGDDLHGKIYITEEEKGIWEFSGEPDDTASGKLIVPLGEQGLVKDLEGITIYPTANGGGYLLVSSQGNNLFYVFDRQTPHKYHGRFRVAGAEITDGIDVIAAPWGQAFPHGLFACHTDLNSKPVLLTPWESIAQALKLPLAGAAINK